MGDVKAKKERRESMRLARSLFIIFVVFAACWTPYAIIVSLDYNDTFSQEFHIFSILLAHTNSSLNSILYGLTNRHFRQGYIKLLGLASSKCNLPFCCKGCVSCTLTDDELQNSSGHPRTAPNNTLDITTSTMPMGTSGKFSPTQVKVLNPRDPYQF